MRIFFTVISIYPILRGLASYVLPRRLFTRPGTGGSFSAEYCYSVWLRHLVHLHRNGLIQSAADLRQVAEIGPGDSLGTGMAALYTGAQEYRALDIIRHADTGTNRRVNDSLLELFVRRRGIPHEAFRDLSPALPDYQFPQELLPADAQAYRNQHARIKQSLEQYDQADTPIRYVLDWMDEKAIPSGKLDLIFSQAAMEHVADIRLAYRLMHRMLRNGGIISHQVDFRAHEMSADWDGHFFIGPRTWQLLAHGRKYPMNRLPLSAHVEALTEAGFRLAAVVKQTGTSTRSGQQTAVPGVHFNPDDRVTMGALIQAVKI